MKKSYDYIIVGAGAAGCIMAARLSEDSGSSVLLIEAGGSDRSLIIEMPAALPFAYESKRLGWGYQSGPEPYLNSRQIDEKRGRVMGGSTSINAMIYNRGNPLDFEHWAASGLPEWSYANCLPYFRRMETFSGGENEWRGGSGPMHITRCKADHKLHECFFRGGEQAGYAKMEDHNAYRQEGLHAAQVYIDQGYRWTTARGYLTEAKGRENLTILSETFVERVVLDHGIAVGVTVTKNGESHTLTCRREIVLCAGAFNSPQILMLSGIGEASQLHNHSIAVLADIPQVGKNLENHPGVNIQYSAKRSDSLVAQLGTLGKAKMGIDWILRKKGLGTTNFFDAGAFLRTRPDLSYPNVQFEFLALTRLLRNGKLIAIPGFQFWTDLSRPASRGTVTLRSANPKDKPRIVFNHMQERQDIRDMIDAIRLARTLIAQPAWDAVRGVEIAPGPGAQTDQELEAFIRSNTGTSYHPAGTCRMGADDEAVVDTNGKVKGIGGLRVVDASIMPRIVTANLSAAIMMMAEKISDNVRSQAPLAASTAKFYRSDA